MSMPHRLFPRVILMAGLALAACVPGEGPRLLRLGGLTTPPLPDLPPGEMRAAAHAGRMVLRIPQKGLAVTLLAFGGRDGVIRWRSTDNVQIITRDGMIIRTHGLGFDLMAVEADEVTALIRSGKAGQTTRIHRLLDGEDRTMIRSWICDLDPAGTESLRTGDTSHVKALKLIETCHGPSGGFVNTHWTRAGEILQSWQYIGPGLGQLQLLFLPPASATAPAPTETTLTLR